MKKLFFMAAIAVLGMTNVTAQERSSGEIEVTPYVAYSGAYLNGDSAAFYESLFGISFGVKGDYFLNDRWSVRSGLNYDAMGTATTGSSSEVKLSYLSVPLNANWHFGSTRKWNLNFGLTPSFLLNAEDELGADLSSAVESFQFGVSYGIGYKIEVSEAFSVLLDVQNFYGLSDIASSSSIKNSNAYSHFGVGGVFVF